MAPSNSTRSLITILGTAITRYRWDSSGNSLASMHCAVTRADAIAMCCARRTARGQCGQVGVAKTLMTTSSVSPSSAALVSSLRPVSPLEVAMIESTRLENS